jgi:TolB-like protein/DNA-binding winged helix-turn-helix (wHTH) protein
VNEIGKPYIPSSSRDLPPSKSVSRRYLLGEFELDSGQRRLSREGVPVHLSNKPFQILIYLIEHHERLVTRAELLDRFWEGKDVYDDSLRKAVGVIRKALDDRRDPPRFIETRYGEGFRYIGPLSEAGTVANQATGLDEASIAASPPSLPPSARLLPHQYARMAAIFGLVAGILILLIVASAYRSHTPGVGKSAVRPRSLVVLPLKNLSGDPAQEYFSDGLTEHLINTLAKIEGVKVIARGSAFTFKEQDTDPQEVGKRLDVTAVLEGSVLRRGERVRVAVRLVSAEDGRVLWASDTSDHTFGDIFAVQDEIARQAVAGLKIKLSAESERQLARRYTENIEAYQACLKGNYFRNQRTPDGLRKAIESYEQAIARDPRYLPAHLGLVSSYYMGMWYIPLEPKEAAAKAKAAALKALEIDDTSSDAHLALAGILWLEWDWAGCFSEMKRAVELGLAASDYGYAYQLLLVAGQPDEGVRWIKRSAELDPLSPLVSANVGEILYYARRYDEAIAQCQKTIELDPNYAMAHTHLGLAYVQKGRHDEAIAEFQKAIALSNRSPDLLGHLGHAYAAAGRRDEAQRVLAELTEVSKQHHVPPYRLAEIQAALGEKDQAFIYLEQAYQAHAMHLCNLRVEPTLDPLRADPRFTDLVRRVGLAQ